MGDIQVRYGCEDCRKWTSDPEEFIKVVVRPFNSKTDDLPERVELYCGDCFREREYRYRGVGYINKLVDNGA